jgi:hypothetical protein
MSDQDPWRVHIALDPYEVSALQVAMLAVPRERWEVRLPHIEEDALPALLMDVRAPSRESAEREAERLYARARAHAGLQSGPALILGALTPMFAAAPHDRLIDDADLLIEIERFDWAVVRAQTACETYAVLALDHIAEGRAGEGKRGSDLFRAVTLSDRRDRALLRELTGVRIGCEGWWANYRLHVERRNAIVHTALSVSEQQALDSLAAARSFIAFLQERWVHRGERRSQQAPDPPQVR